MSEEKICRNCEYYDDGTGEKRTAKNGDCHNSHSSPRFQTDPYQTCKGFYPDTTRSKPMDRDKLKQPKKLFQTKFGKPEGNCFSTCLAMLLDLSIEEVPCFHDEKGKWYQDYRKWLKPLGYDFVSMAPSWSDEQYKPYCPQVYCIGSGKSPRGEFDHSTVYFGNELYHDPHPDGTGVVTLKDFIYLIPLLPLIESREVDDDVIYLKDAFLCQAKEYDRREGLLKSKLAHETRRADDLYNKTINELEQELTRLKSDKATIRVPAKIYFGGRDSPQEKHRHQRIGFNDAIDKITELNPDKTIVEDNPKGE